jgi:mannose-6-phosphate isomerase-like protein (cupin superfamily)
MRFLMPVLGLALVFFAAFGPAISAANEGIIDFKALANFEVGERRAMEVYKLEVAPGYESWTNFENHSVMYILEGSAIWEPQGEKARVYRAGELIEISPIDAVTFRNASQTESLTYIYFTVGCTYGSGEYYECPPLDAKVDPVQASIDALSKGAN